MIKQTPTRLRRLINVGYIIVVAYCVLNCLIDSSMAEVRLELAKEDADAPLRRHSVSDNEFLYKGLELEELQ